MNRVGKYTVALERVPKVNFTASVVGEKEASGRYGKYFDSVVSSDRFGVKSWEKAESKMQKQVVAQLLEKSGKKASEIDFILGGDLLNQCVGTSFGIIDYEIPFFGLYGACSTMCESLCIGSMIVDGGYADNVICLTSSHYASSERQYRFPLEYGKQRTPTAQWTVTGSGGAIVSSEKGSIGITHITPGRIVDMGIKDANNMGAAMAPSAIDTISRHFKDLKIDEDYYDLVVTGDLGVLGKEIALEQLEEQGLQIANKYIDCGAEIFDIKKQDMHAGGSGCGCIASMFASYIYKEMQNEKFNKVLLVGTGALLSPTSTFQGESIPGIAHAVSIERI